MAHYFVDNRPQPDGAHAVHAKGCAHMASDKRYLGEFVTQPHALMEARKAFWTTCACARCYDVVPTRPSPFWLGLAGLKQAS